MGQLAGFFGLAMTLVAFAATLGAGRAAALGRIGAAGAVASVAVAAALQAVDEHQVWQVGSYKFGVDAMSADQQVGGAPDVESEIMICGTPSRRGRSPVQRDAARAGSAAQAPHRVGRFQKLGDAIQMIDEVPD